jgi:hypothetical protein
VPSQFSAVGFQVSSGEELSALASRVAGTAETIKVKGGEYLKWAPPSGEQLWLQVSPKGDAMGMTPHFAGKSRVRVTLEARVARPTHTPLEGTFLAWANADSVNVGDRYPFAFDAPDAALHAALALPATLDAQIAAFAQQVTVHASEAAYQSAQSAQGLNFPSRSFIPSGLFTPAGEPVSPPEPHALIAGQVIEADLRQNTVSGTTYWWALVDTTGGTFDVVIDPALVEGDLEPGQVLSGWFWLSGCLLRDVPSPAGASWWQRIAGR